MPTHIKASAFHWDFFIPVLARWNGEVLSPPTSPKVGIFLSRSFLGLFLEPPGGFASAGWRRQQIPESRNRKIGPARVGGSDRAPGHSGGIFLSHRRCWPARAAEDQRKPG
jgi:hypothetical protein